MGRIFGVELRIHFLFLLLFPFISFSERAAHLNATPERLTALIAILLASGVYLTIRFISDDPVSSQRS